MDRPSCVDGRELAALRKQLGITVEELSPYLGYSPGHVYNQEINAKRIFPYQAKAYMRALLQISKERVELLQNNDMYLSFI